MSSRIRLTLLALILVGLGGYYAYILSNKKIPCVTPIIYSLVLYDSRFVLPQSEVERDIGEAAQVWNDALGKEVLVPGIKPELPIYFLYQSGQQIVSTVNSLQEEIKTLQAQRDQISKQSLALSKQISEAQRLGQDTQSLKLELQSLQKKDEHLRQQISADSAIGRDIVPSGDITAGQYISNEKGERINIYLFQNTTELKRALRHEFGHALGLNHVSSPDSMMYPMNNGSENLELTTEDKAELAKACNFK
jgi:hypothetical protein